MFLLISFDCIRVVRLNFYYDVALLTGFSTSLLVKYLNLFDDWLKSVLRGISRQPVNQTLAIYIQPNTLLSLHNYLEKSG